MRTIQPASQPRAAILASFVLGLWLTLAAPHTALAQAREPAVGAPALVAAPQLGTAAPPGSNTVALPNGSFSPSASSGGSAAPNPYGLGALWQQGDLVAKATLVVLAIMSLASWYVLITKLLEQQRMGRQARQARQQFWAADKVSDGAATLDAASPYRFIAESALEGTRQHSGLVAQVDLNSWVIQCIERAAGVVQNRTQAGLAVLATVGSTSPFVGLFGTVWGIYNALVRIGATGQASIDKVAGPVGEALIMTAIGLAVAVPAVLLYNYLVRRNKVITEKLRAFAGDLQTYLVKNAK